MSETGPAFAPDAYVVRYGARAILRAIRILLGGLAVIGYGVIEHKDVVREVFALIFGVALAWLAIVELSRAVRRQVVFAMHQGGVYFGSDPFKDNVAWSQICAIEFFTETTVGSKSQSRYRCIGVRSLGTRQTRRAGNGAAASPLGERGEQYLIDAGRPDLIPGADGTIRRAYRQMSGWRVDRAKVAAAAARYAPGLPVINGLNYPPLISRADVHTVRQTRRGF